MGLFEHYPGSAEAAIETGEKQIDTHATFDLLESNLQGQEDTAAAETAGDLTAPTGDVAVKPRHNASDMGRAALVSGGAIRHFAKAITTYNEHIDELNQEYEQSKANDFGVTGLCTEDGIQEPTQEAKTTAKEDVIARLEKKRKGYEEDLDNAADFAAGLLNGEPSNEALLSLFITGDLTPGDVAGHVEMDLETLNNIRFGLAGIQYVATARDALPALLQYLTKTNFKSMQGRVDIQSAMHIRAIVNSSRQQQLSLAQRLAAFKKAKLDVADLGRILRNQNMVKNGKPGALLGRYGKNLRIFGPISKGIGKVLPPLAVVSGGMGVYDAIANPGNDRSTFDRVTGGISSGLFGLSGALAIGAAIPTPASPFLAAGAGIAAGAGLVAYGVQHYDDIWNGAKWLGGKISDGLGAAWDWATGADDPPSGPSECPAPVPSPTPGPTPTPPEPSTPTPEPSTPTPSPTPSAEPGPPPVPSSSSDPPGPLEPPDVVPAPEPLPPENVSEPSPAPYEVQPGDSLWRIAQNDLPSDASAQDVSERVHELYDTNREEVGVDPDLIYPGQDLEGAGR